MDYQFKRKPRAKQLEAFLRSRDAEVFALFMEQRTGKSKVVIDTTCYQYGRGTIDCLLVFTLNDVHRNWITDEAPQDVPDYVPYRGFYWQTGKAGTKRYQQELVELIKFQGLLIISINIDAVLTKNCQDFVRKLLLSRKIMCVVDESTIIKTPGAKRTKIVKAMGARCAMRRILTGTPITKSPLDLYSQVGFLSEDIFGFSSFYAFKHYYAEWEKGFGSGGHEYEKLKCYRNLEELQARLDPHAFRVLRSECSDQPPQVFAKRYFELTPEQRRIYNQLREEYIAELENGDSIQASMAMVRMLRLQQIASGFIPKSGRWSEDEKCGTCGGGGNVDGEPCETCLGYGMAWVETESRMIMPAEENPRLKALLSILEGYEGKAIIWARFKPDVDLIMEALPKIGRRGARYDGKVKLIDRKEQIRQFNANEATDMVGNPHAGGRGLPLHRADLIIYYSNDFDLEIRLQSQDRAEHVDKTEATDVIDLMAVDTVDDVLITSHREKKKIADVITRDKPRAWL